MAPHIVSAHWLKGSIAHVQSNFSDGNASSFNLAQNVLIEMQSGSGGRNCSSLIGINCLIAIPVVHLAKGTAPNIGRQRRLTEIVDDAIQGLISFKSNHAPAVIQQIDNFGFESRFAKDDSRSFSQPPSWSSQRLPNVCLNFPDQEQFHRAARRSAFAYQSRWKYPRVVEDQSVVRI